MAGAQLGLMLRCFEEMRRPKEEIVGSKRLFHWMALSPIESPLTNLCTVPEAELRTKTTATPPSSAITGPNLRKCRSDRICSSTDSTANSLKDHDRSERRNQRFRSKPRVSGEANFGRFGRWSVFGSLMCGRPSTPKRSNWRRWRC